MDASPNPAPDSAPTPSAVERAIAFGVDITLLNFKFLQETRQV